MDKITVVEIMLTGLTTVAAAFFGSMWAHKFAISDQARAERIDDLKNVKKEITLSYRKAMESAELLIVLLAEIKDDQDLRTTYISSKSYQLLHNLRYEILNIEDQKLDLDEDEDDEIIKEINELLTLMKADYHLLDSYSHEISALHHPLITQEEFMVKHKDLMTKLTSVEIEFIAMTDRKIVFKIQERIKKL
ncbi:hypothetical protein ERUR111494_01170 [Erysipelothrix urinaevulpis]|uniref:hypothetical protein n=1 Tax=Erysipelothrix urinaevulpis TaxID=2683717 RepID=UPI001359E161|nr:hypothetical protein [Erysipelothrix urinaevulpis]